MADEQRTRGLAAVKQERDRRAGFPNIPPRLWLWAGIILAAWAILYYKYTQEKLDHTRNELLAKQRDAAKELAPRFTPVRDKLEQWIVDAASPYAGDLITPQAKTSEFRSHPGVYLRELVDDARDPKMLRRAAMDSLRDAFTSCLMRQANPDPWAGPECKRNHDCPAGQYCNETYHCTAPAQPYNMRVFYRAMHVFTEDWVKDVRDAGDDMRLRLLDRDYDSTIRDDVPQAIEMMARAQFFLLVIDELPDGGPAAVPPDAGATMLEAVQTVPHAARVFLYDIGTSKQLMRVRVRGAAELTQVTVGVDGQPMPARGPQKDPKAMNAAKRQASSCTMGMAVANALSDDAVSP